MENKYVIDVNILFSILMSRKEIHKEIFLKNQFFTPDFALNEISKYEVSIIKKSKLTSERLK